MNLRRTTTLLALAALLRLASSADAAFIVEAHSSGKANATNFAIIPGAGNATGASASTVSTAPGLSGTNSIFGSNNNVAGVVDTYQFSYTPGTNADNTTFNLGDPLGNSTASDADGAGPGLPTYTIGALGATAITGGGTGLYRVFFTGPSSTNVNAAGSRFDITSDFGTTTLNPVNLNDTNTGPDEVAGTPFTGGANNRWLLLATVKLTAGTTYTVTVTSNADSFVSQRAQGVMWQMIPEPTSLGLLAMAFTGLAAVRRR
jgi:hypothetical protein